MIRIPAVAFALAVLPLSPASSQAVAPAILEIERRAKTAPPEVAHFITRSLECWHWRGEEPYDDERRRQIISGMQQLRCEELGGDEERLATRYRERHDVLDLLNEARKSLD
jgi:hypothetical protein